MNQESISPIHQPSEESKVQSKLILPEGSKKKEDPNSLASLTLVYKWYLESMQVTQETVRIQAKQLQVNAADVNSMVDREAQISFVEIHTKVFEHFTDWHHGGYYWNGYTFVRDTWVTQRNVWVTQKFSQAQLEEISNANQRAEVLRNNLGDKLNVKKQDAQVLETNINTSVDAIQQSATQGASLMNMLVSLSNQISQI